MKQPVAFFRWRPFLVMLFLSLLSLAIWGQEESGENRSANATDYPVAVDNNAWYTSPWLWVIGAAIIVLLMVALLSSRGGNKRVRAPKINESKGASTIR